MPHFNSRSTASFTTFAEMSQPSRLCVASETVLPPASNSTRNSPSSAASPSEAPQVARAASNWARPLPALAASIMTVYAATASVPLGESLNFCARPYRTFSVSSLIPRPRWQQAAPSLEPPHVALQCRTDALVRTVADAVLTTGLLDDARERRVVQVTHPGEEVVLHLEVQSSQVPAHQRVAPREVHRRQDLVRGPVARK